MNVDLTWFALTALIILIETYRDLKKMKIDERHVYMLFGYTLFLALYHGISLFELIGFTIAAAVIYKLSKPVSLGDKLLLTVLLIGHYETGTVVWFVLTFSAMLLTYIIGMKMRGRTGKAAGLPIILLSHLLTLPFFL